MEHARNIINRWLENMEFAPFHISLSLFSSFCPLSPRPNRPNKHSNVDQVQDQRWFSADDDGDDDDGVEDEAEIKRKKREEIFPHFGLSSFHFSSEIKDCNLNISFSFITTWCNAIEWWLGRRVFGL